MADDPFGSLIDGYQEEIKKVAKRIGTKKIEVEAAEGMIKVTALASGELVDLYISARAAQQFDNQTLSEKVLGAAKKALARAAEAKTEALRPLIADDQAFDDIIKKSKGMAREMGLEPQHKRQSSDRPGADTTPPRRHYT